MQELVRIWKGPFSLTIFVNLNKLSVVDKWLFEYSSIANLRVVIYIVPVSSSSSSNYVFWNRHGVLIKEYENKVIYPINLLRDLSIMNVVTSHYVNLDMDLWPSCINTF
jgi:hypothetical protein